METKKVYAAIAAVAGELATIGISKDKKNQQQGYSFRGIDDVYNALAPLLSKHNLVILPRVIGREVTERATQKGGVLFYVVVTVEFDFVSAEDSSCHTVKTIGEAMDSADKATNKAMSAAYKYAAFQAFCIPTEADDADATTPPELTGNGHKAEAPKQNAKESPKPEPPKSEAPKPTKPEAPTNGNGSQPTNGNLSNEQRKNIYQIARAAGRNDEQYKAFIASFGYKSSAEIPVSRYSEISTAAALRP